MFTAVREGHLIYREGDFVSENLPSLSRICIFINSKLISIAHLPHIDIPILAV